MSSPFFGKNVQAAMRDGVVAVDARGLMPLDEARAIVGAASEFRKGEGTMIGGTQVLPSDRLWAALLSLEDAAEFVREAGRIQWLFHPRGKDNIAPLERYGRAVLPWIERFVLPDGRLVNVPWCITACLLEIDGEDVFDLLWRVRTILKGTGTEGPGPFAADAAGDADKRAGTDLAAEPPGEPDKPSSDLLRKWVARHPQAGLPPLARRARNGENRARVLLAAIARMDPTRMFCVVRDAIGETEARAAFEAAGAPTALDEDTILETLDQNEMDRNWPELFGDSYSDAYHALRLIAVREVNGDGWGVLFERLQGGTHLHMQPFSIGSARSERIQPRHTLGFFVLPEPPDPDPSVDDPQDIEGVELLGPSGSLDLRRSMIGGRDLRPGLATGAAVKHSRFSVMARAYLAEYPSAFWGDPAESAKLLGIDDFEVIAVSTAFEHVVRERASEAYPAAWRISPKDSPVYRSLARALVKRDGALFEPGTSNLDFRLHALSPPYKDRDAPESDAVLAERAVARVEERRDESTDVFLRVYDPDADTQATMHADAVGLESLKEGFAFSPAQDRLFALGWPHMRLLADGWVEDDDPVSSARDRIKFAEDFRLVWPRETAYRLVRAWGSGRTFSRKGPRSPEVIEPAAEAALAIEGPVDVDEAKRIVLGQFNGQGSFATSFRDVAECYVLLLEAMVGPGPVAHAILDALEALDDASLAEKPRHRGDRTNVVYMIGYLLLRLPRAENEAVLERLRRSYRRARDLAPASGFTRVLACLLDPPAEERYYLGCVTNPEHLRRALDIHPSEIGPSGTAGVHDAQHVYVGGPAVLDIFARRWREQMSSQAQLDYFVATIGEIRSPKVVAILRDIERTSPGRGAAREWLTLHRDDALVATMAFDGTGSGLGDQAKSAPKTPLFAASPPFKPRR